VLNNNNEEKFIDLKELSQLLLFNDTRSALKWCEAKKIEIQKIGKKQVVYQFIVEMELDKKLIKELQKKYPLKWEELYRCYQDNDRLGYLLLIDSNPEMKTTRIKQRVVSQSSFSKGLKN